jgi:enoyl-[acyl-carrier protein] reductase II
MHFTENKICRLLELDFPIIQAGMVWCSGWRLASAVSNTGALGVIGAGSMYPEVLALHIDRLKENCQKPFAVNLPLLYSHTEAHIETIIEKKVPIVITSAGNPSLYTTALQAHGIKVIHVVSSLKFAQKAIAAGVDALVAEGFEAGGHNGKEETTTFCLIPLIAQQTNIPLIAAGGIVNGQTMHAAMVLGADAVQMGSRFVAAAESSAHQLFKERVVASKEGETKLQLKRLNPVRLLLNEFSSTVDQLEQNGATPQELSQLLGKGRAMKGMFNGDLLEGELEIGQCSSLINSILPASRIVHTTLAEFEQSIQKTTGWL